MTLSRKMIASYGTYKKIDYVSLVEALHGLNFPELRRLLRDSEHNITAVRNSSLQMSQFSIEDLGMLPMHLMVMVLEANQDEAFFKYLLSGLTLLNKLYCVADRHPTLKQMLRDDVRVLRQSVDLIFYIITVLNKLTEENQCSVGAICLHSTILAGSLNLLGKCVSPDWKKVAIFLSIHPEADKLIEAVFVAVHMDVELLHKILSVQVHCPPEMTNHLCQQCEASLQCIHALCQEKSFQDYLVRHEVLSGKYGILLLVQCVLNLNIPTLNLNIPTPVEQLSYFAAAVSRMKSKVLSIWWYLCEVNSISYLDEIGKSPRSLGIARTVAVEVLELLKSLFRGRYREHNFCLDKDMPQGLLRLNAMHITEILSDDTNFRSYITMHMTDILSTLFLLQNEEFESIWCTPELLLGEEDATLDYDPFVAAGWVLNSLSNEPVTGSPKSTYTYNLPRDSYTDQRTSLLVKIIANLHCFAPDIYGDEKDKFLNSLFSRLQKEIFKSLDGAYVKASDGSKNLGALMTRAESLRDDYLSEQDVQILRLFVAQLDSLITAAGNMLQPFYH